MTEDERLVADELAELAHYSGQQARAEAKLLRMLPVQWAASVLREDALDALAGNGERGAWRRYLRLEAEVIRLRILEPRQTWSPRPSVWDHLEIGDEPDQLRYARAGWRVATAVAGMAALERDPRWPHWQ